LCGTVVTIAGQAPAGQPAQQPPAAAPGAQGGQGGPGDPNWLPPEPKNLKILPKDIDRKELLNVMRSFSQAMGVRCVYCHVAGSDPNDWSAYNFESDRKENKEATRAMMKYTDAVNQSFPTEVGDEPKAGEQRVTCYTCHQGQRHPPTRRPEGAGTGRPGAPAGPAQGPPAQAQPPQGQPPRPPAGL
jgi:hypothetical protein